MYEEAGSTHGHTHHSIARKGSIVTENKAYTTVLSCHGKLVSALSPDTRTIAGILMENGFIPPEIHAEILLLSSTPHVKATNLVYAIMEKIKIAPKRFHELIKIFSEQKWTTDIAEILQSAYQGNLSYYTVMGVWITGVHVCDYLFPLSLPMQKIPVS